ncbi:GYF domain-containing protein, partial [Candidatus Bathyarchaeota archaeon]|nr:GYF domain-containing protein [Candidatus Bathyarchaeota archaeon]
MQAQMQGQGQDQDNLADSVPDLRQNNHLGAIGRGSMPGPGREGDAIGRQGQGGFDDVFGSDAGRTRGLFGSGDTQPGLTAASQSPFTSTASGAPFAVGQPSGDAPPASQVRQMVMPDRMRWVYLDPQGQVQGPFTGLEMNDWYKANFFTPDLRVKKIEDSDFEPLGQLIRRIGNSREPFLVPQIGVPHGPVPQNSSFTPAGNPSVVPPLSGVFPSYGRTLTADEQNNLERRKQEEQILMAQQREFILRQQTVPPKFPMGGAAGALNHTSSAQSLQSQPSFGSISSPIGPPGQGPVGHGAPGSSAMFDPTSAAQSGAANLMGSGIDPFQEHDLANLTTPERQVIAHLQDSSGISAALQHGGAPGQGVLAGLRTQLPATDQLNEDPQGFRERLMEFEQLRAGLDAEARGQMSPHEHESFEPEQFAMPSAPAGPPQDTGAGFTQVKNRSAGDDRAPPRDQSQRVQAPPAFAPPAFIQATGMPMPFPPPEPLEEELFEAPMAEPAQPPPMAPWAKEASSEVHRGPSLKEIQEAEAQKEAKVEQAAQAARRAALEQEAAEIREKERAVAAAAVAPGLPTSSTWGHASPANTTSPWAKPAAPTATGTGGLSAAQAEKKRKTLADIQREEEARKQKAREIAGNAPGGAPVSSAGKRYADLASKPNPPGLPLGNAPAPMGGITGWATVGAGGKVKAPPGAPSPQPPRAPSVSAQKPVAKPVVKPVVVPAAPKPDGATVAMDEFKKWLHRELSRGITGVSN